MVNNPRELLDYESIVMDAILSHGYPRESIVLSGNADSRRFVDFIINDVDTGLPMMMIDVKSCSERTHTSVRRMAFGNLKRSYEKDSLPIKAIAAILDREAKKLEFIDFTEAIRDDDFGRAVNDYILPPYEILTIGARQKAINKQKEENEKKMVALKWLCWLILPAVCLALILLDGFGLYILSSLRLITISAGAAVSLIPCFKEISIGEITLKNIIENQK